MHLHNKQRIILDCILFTQNFVLFYSILSRCIYLNQLFHILFYFYLEYAFTYSNFILFYYILYLFM